MSISCAALVPHPVDDYPVRSSQIVHSTIATTVANVSATSSTCPPTGTALVPLSCALLGGHDTYASCRMQLQRERAGKSEYHQGGRNLFDWIISLVDY